MNGASQQKLNKVLSLVQLGEIKTKGGIMLWRWFNRKEANSASLFAGHFIEVKALYIQRFGALPSVSFIGELDVTKAYAFVNERLGGCIMEAYQHSYFDHKEQQLFFNNTILVLNSNRVIELGNNYCQVLHALEHYAWANEFVLELAAFRMVNNEPTIGFTRQTTMN